MELQELVSRARMLLVGAPKRVQVFQLVNGKKNTWEIARKTGRGLSAVLQDLQKMRDMGLISQRKTSAGKLLVKDGYAVYEKHTLLKHLSAIYFRSPEKVQAHKPKQQTRNKTKKRYSALKIPTATEIIDICCTDEDQLYEFKEAGVEATKISKEIAAFANTKTGGFIFYGVDDSGTINGTDKSRQALDPAVQGSIKSMVSPTVSVRIVERDVLGVKIIVIAVPPRDPDEVHRYNNVVYIRKGTTSTPATDSEVRKMYRGEYII